MTSRTILLTLHLVFVAGWLGADLVVHVLEPRVRRDSSATQTAWTRQLLWMHQRYYAAVAVLILATGVLLVLDGDWSWSSGFIWVGIGAVVGGGVFGGGGLGTLAKQRLAALESGDAAGFEQARRRMVPLSVFVTLLPVVAILAMVDKWQA